MVEAESGGALAFVWGEGVEQSCCAARLAVSCAGQTWTSWGSRKRSGNSICQLYRRRGGAVI